MSDERRINLLNFGDELIFLVFFFFLEIPILQNSSQIPYCPHGVLLIILALIPKPEGQRSRLNDESASSVFLNGNLNLLFFNWENIIIKKGAAEGKLLGDVDVEMSQFFLSVKIPNQQLVRLLRANHSTDN